MVGWYRNQLTSGASFGKRVKLRRMVGGAGISRGGSFDRRVLSRDILVGMVRLRDGDGIAGVFFATQAARIDRRKLFFLG
jgi:hypothetical protein